MMQTWTCAALALSPTQQKERQAKSTVTASRFHKGETCSPCVIELVKTKAQCVRVPWMRSLALANQHAA
ncbi:MAG TPA: hypothetical protein DD637_05730 [Verrucomicrobia bacterium]|nr:hypothetical protein [Verrucomicrobiota bacterium]